MTLITSAMTRNVAIVSFSLNPYPYFYPYLTLSLTLTLNPYRYPNPCEGKQAPKQQKTVGQVLYDGMYDALTD